MDVMVRERRIQIQREKLKIKRRNDSQNKSESVSNRDDNEALIRWLSVIIGKSSTSMLKKVRYVL